MRSCQARTTEARRKSAIAGRAFQVAMQAARVVPLAVPPPTATPADPPRSRLGQSRGGPTLPHAPHAPHRAPAGAPGEGPTKDRTPRSTTHKAPTYSCTSYCTQLTGLGRPPRKQKHKPLLRISCWSRASSDADRRPTRVVTALTSMKLLHTAVYTSISCKLHQNELAVTRWAPSRGPLRT